MITREMPSQTCLSRAESERRMDGHKCARSSRQFGANITKNRVADRTCDRDRGGEKEIDKVPTPKDGSDFDQEADRNRPGGRNIGS